MRNRNAILVALSGLGGFTVASQILLLRGFLGLLGGNELSLGVVMGMWLLFTGAGAWMARLLPVRKGKEAFALFLLFLLSLLPLLALFRLGLWKINTLPYGTAAGAGEVLQAGLLALLPVCLLSGYLFILLTSLLRDAGDQRAAGRAYAVESLGGLLGGALVNFVLLWHVPSFLSLRIILTIFLALAVLYAFLRFRLRGGIPALAAAGIVTAGIFLFPFEPLTWTAQYREQEVVLDKETPYGKVTVTRSGEQLNFYGDDALLFSSGNTIWNEESVHFALLQRRDPESVLLIGGGLSGAISEILKYHPGRIDYAEINPVIAGLAKDHLPSGTAVKVRILPEDARSILQREELHYDAVLVNVPEPISMQLNRYYTIEFANMLKRSLSPGGVVSFSLPSTAEYVSPGAGRVNGVLYTTLKKVFRNVVIVPGNRNWFLASDGPLMLDIGAAADRRIPDNLFVNGFYIDDGMLKDRSAFILKNLPPDLPVNHDFHPVAYRHQLSVWLSRSGIGWPAVAGGAGAVLLLVLLLLNRIGAGLFSAGFTGAATEVTVMLAFQVALGYMAGMLGIVIMIFMAGLAAGPWLAQKLPGKFRVRTFRMLQGGMAAMPLLLFGTAKIIETGRCGPATITTLLLIITLAVALILSMQYTVANTFEESNPVRAAARNYASDLFGSALGAFLVPVFFLPLIGIGWTAGVLVGMNVASALIKLKIEN